MAATWNKVTKEYRPSVHTPDFAADPDVVVFARARDNADRDALLASAVPPKYWKPDGDRVVEMTTAEKAATDATAQAALAVAQKAAAETVAAATVAQVKGALPLDVTATLEERVRALEKMVFGG